MTWDPEPSGINFNPTTLTIEGTFNGSISTETTYTYTITTNGSCQTISSSGNITVKPDDELGSMHHLIIIKLFVKGIPFPPSAIL